jgi:hypothetical protein
MSKEFEGASPFTLTFREGMITLLSSLYLIDTTLIDAILCRSYQSDL